MLVVELVAWPNWGLGAGVWRERGPRALTLLTGVVRHQVTYWVEKLGLDALTLLTGVTRRGVTSWVEKRGLGVAPGAGCGPGSTLPHSMLLPLPVLECGCVEGAGGVGKTIISRRWAISCWWPPLALFCDELVMAVHFWMTPQPLRSCEAVAAYM